MNNNNNDISNNDISHNDISHNDISNNDYQNNLIVDLSNSNLNETNDSVTNLMQNIFNDVVRRRREDVSNNQINLENNHERLRYFFNNNNQSFDNLFRDINPMLLSTSEFEQHPLLTMDLDEIFSNLISNIRGNTRTSINSFNNVLNSSFEQDKNKYKKILSNKGKEQLKKVKFNDSSKNNTSCPIFHTEFENDDTIIELPCLHCFTPEAIERWLSEESAQCPVCRFELDSEEVEIKEKNNDDVETEAEPEADTSDPETDNENNEADDFQDENRQIQQAILESFKD